MVSHGFPWPSKWWWSTPYAGRRRPTPASRAPTLGSPGRRPGAPCARCCRGSPPGAPPKNRGSVDQKKRHRPIRIDHRNSQGFWFLSLKWRVFLSFSHHVPIMFLSFSHHFPIMFPSCSLVFPRKIMGNRSFSQRFPMISTARWLHGHGHGHGTARVSIKGPKKMARSTRRRWRFTTKRSYRPTEGGGRWEKNDGFLWIWIWICHNIYG